MRQRGSVRFAPYYKVQWFDETSLCWRDVQQAHSSETEARAAFLADRRCRVMAITERGRQAVG
jgi:hypothetical protein